MQNENHHPNLASARGALPFRLPSARHWVQILGCFVAVAILTGTAHSGQDPLPPRGSPDRPSTTGMGNVLPGSVDQIRMREQKIREKNYAAANSERIRQIGEDSAILLKLAADLKAELDKTEKDTPSLKAIHEAELIERLSHNVQEKMKLTVGPS